MTLILDFGSGNTCQNDFHIVKRMLGCMRKVDSKKYPIVVKWQLFRAAHPNAPLLPQVFQAAYYAARDMGYACTASVFDEQSCEFLLKYQVPFVKIATGCPDPVKLIDMVPRRIPIVRSFAPRLASWGWNQYNLQCVAEYPADPAKYDHTRVGFDGISDHTVGWDMFKKAPWYNYWEKHYRLPESTGLDAGPFACTAEELKEIM